jgi:hypothetical protein
VRLDARALDSLDEIAAMLAQPATSSSSLVARLRALQEQPDETPAVPTPSAPAPAEAPPAAPHDESVAFSQAAAPTLEASPPASAPEPVPGVMTPTRASTVASPSRSPQERDRTAAAAVARAATVVPKPELGSLLDAGIAKLGDLHTTPLVAPVSIPEQPAVPIDVLLYRGRAAIERCLEIREQVRSAGGAVDADTLDELFDLLDLALTD